MTEPPKKKIYFNAPQRLTQLIGANTTVIVAGRRTGKTDSIASPFVLRNMQRMQGSTGGIKSYFGHHSFNHSVMILSDMPQTQKGSWFLHYQDKMDVALIETIKATVYEIWRIKERIRTLRAKGATVPGYLRRYLRNLDTNPNKMRSVAVYYKEYSSIENLQLLGENYIKQMKRDLTPKTFQTSILCQRIGIAKDGFYSSMREGHKYNASDFE